MLQITLNGAYKHRKSFLFSPEHSFVQILRPESRHVTGAFLFCNPNKLIRTFGVGVKHADLNSLAPGLGELCYLPLFGVRAKKHAELAPGLGELCHLPSLATTLTSRTEKHSGLWSAPKTELAGRVLIDARSSDGLNPQPYEQRGHINLCLCCSEKLYQGSLAEIPLFNEKAQGRRNRYRPKSGRLSDDFVNKQAELNLTGSRSWGAVLPAVCELLLKLVGLREPKHSVIGNNTLPDSPSATEYQSPVAR
jgi:hypothetical protein